MTLFTASESARAIACPASCALPQVRTTSRYAVAGTEAHAEREANIPPVVREWFGSARPRTEVAMAYDVATDDARELAAAGREYDATETEIPGRADVCSATRVGDYKTGYERPGHAADLPQLHTYALAVARIHDSRSVDVAIFRGGAGEEVTLDSHATIGNIALARHSDALARAADRVRDARLLVAGGSVPGVSPGAHCRWCPAKPCCPAFVGAAHALASTAPETLTRLLTADGMATAKATMQAQLSALSVEDAGKAWAAVDVYWELLDAAREQLESRAKDEGSLPLPDGTRVVPTTSTTEKIDGEKALPILIATFGGDVERVTKTGVTKADVEREFRRKAQGNSSEALRQMAARSWRRCAMPARSRCRRPRSTR